MAPMWGINVGDDDDAPRKGGRQRLADNPDGLPVWNPPDDMPEAERIASPPEGARYCPYCQKAKPLTGYHGQQRKWGGRRCPDCLREYNRQKYSADAERRRAAAREKAAAERAAAREAALTDIRVAPVPKPGPVVGNDPPPVFIQLRDKWGRLLNPYERRREEHRRARAGARRRRREKEREKERRKKAARDRARGFASSKSAAVGRVRRRARGLRRQDLGGRGRRPRNVRR